MKKGQIIIMLFLLATNTVIIAQSKWEMGVSVGPAWSKPIRTGTTSPNTNPPNVEVKYGLGFTSGIDFYRLFGNHVVFATGIKYKTTAYHDQLLEESGNYVSAKINQHLLTLPLTIRYVFSLKQHRFFVNVGTDLSWNYKTIYKTADNKYVSNINYWNPVYEYFFGFGYMYKINDKHTLFVNPEYLPKLFTNDYNTFRLNFGVVLNY